MLDNREERFTLGKVDSVVFSRGWIILKSLFKWDMFPDDIDDENPKRVVDQKGGHNEVVDDIVELACRLDLTDLVALHRLTTVLYMHTLGKLSVVDSPLG